MRSQMTLVLIPLMVLMTACGKQSDHGGADNGVSPIIIPIEVVPGQDPGDTIVAQPLPTVVVTPEPPVSAPDASQGESVISQPAEVVEPVEISPELTEGDTEHVVNQPSDSQTGGEQEADEPGAIQMPESDQIANSPGDTEITVLEYQIPKFLKVVSGYIGNHKVVLRIGKVTCDFRAQEKGSVVLELRKCSNGATAGDFVMSTTTFQIQVYGAQAQVSLD